MQKVTKHTLFIFTNRERRYFKGPELRYLVAKKFDIHSRIIKEKSNIFGNFLLSSVVLVMPLKICIY